MNRVTIALTTALTDACRADPTLPLMRAIEGLDAANFR